MVVGELVSGSGSDSTGTVQTVPGAEIASISGSQVTLTLPLTGTATDNHTPFTSVTFTGDNTGTLIVDFGGDCYQKTDYRGEPHEFGAVGDGQTDDTTAIQYWLGAYGNVFSGAPATAPGNFGPWLASIPAVYDVQNPAGLAYPLVCPTSAALAASANLWVGQKSNGSPPVMIQADNSGSKWPAAGALFALSDNCRLAGIGVNAAKVNQIDAVDVVGRDVAIDSHAVIETGYVDVNCNIPSANSVGLQVKDAQILSAATDNVLIGSNCPNIRLIGDVNSGAGKVGAAAPDGSRFRESFDFESSAFSTAEDA